MTFTWSEGPCWLGVALCGVVSIVVALFPVEGAPCCVEIPVGGSGCSAWGTSCGDESV